MISASSPGDIQSDLKRCLCNRGPDHISTHAVHLGENDNKASSTHLAFTSTVLALRGDHLAHQPFVDTHSGSVFCWNGEAWRIRHGNVSGNDGEAIAGLLNEAVQYSTAEREGAIMRVLRSIDGPFAFVFFDKPSRHVYFGRDRLGRRSLLYRLDGEHLILSSIAESINPEWKEVEADGIYKLDLNIHRNGDESIAMSPAITRLEWLEEEDAADFVSMPLQQHLVPRSICRIAMELTNIGLCHWAFQYLGSQPRGHIPGINLASSQRSSPAADGVAQTARPECARTARCRWSPEPDKGCRLILGRIRLHCDSEALP